MAKEPQRKLKGFRLLPSTVRQLAQMAKDGTKEQAIVDQAVAAAWAKWRKANKKG